jgi:hypothetical protein
VNHLRQYREIPSVIVPRNGQFKLSLTRLNHLWRPYSFAMHWPSMYLGVHVFFEHRRAGNSPASLSFDQQENTVIGLTVIGVEARICLAVISRNRGSHTCRSREWKAMRARDQAVVAARVKPRTRIGRRPASRRH